MVRLPPANSLNFTDYLLTGQATFVASAEPTQVPFVKSAQVVEYVSVDLLAIH